MKQIYTLLFALFIGLASFARPVNKINTWYGNWSSASSWSLGRVPQDGDSIVIYGGRAILVDKNFNLKNVYIKVIDNNSYIHLKGKLILDDASFLEIGVGSRIMAFGANRNAETIQIGGVKKFDQNMNVNFYGFGIASKYTGASPSGFTTDIAMALPVTFLSFVAEKQNNAILLTWSTAQEKNNSHFEVEKSFDGRTWTVAGIVFGNGTTSNVSQYSFTDKENASVIYYRIRQVDQDDKAVYTAVKVIRGTEAQPATHIYSPAKNKVIVDLNKEMKSTLTVTVVNLNGQVIAQQSFSKPSYRIDMNVNAASSGMYVVRVSDNNGFAQASKVVF